MLDKIKFEDITKYRNKALIFQDCHYDAGFQTSKSATDAWNRIFKDQILFIKEGNYVENILTIDRGDDDKRQDVLIIFRDLRLLSKYLYQNELFYLKSVKRYLEQFEG